MKTYLAHNSELLNTLIRKLSVVNLLLLPLSLFGATPPYVEGELLVKFKGGPGGEPAAQAENTFKHKVKRNFHHLGWQYVKLPPGQTVAGMMHRYQQHPDVMAVQPNYLLKVHAFTDCPGVVPNDPLFSSQGALARIGATNAWCVTNGSHDVVVAVIDSGIFYGHEDLTANMWTNRFEIPENGIDDDGNGYIDDIYGIDVVDNDGDPDDGWLGPASHGTFGAGIIGAVGNNGIGMSGVNWSVQLMALRFFSATCAGGTPEKFAELCDYILDQKLSHGVNIRVASCAWSWEFGYDPGIIVSNALQSLGNADILNVFAAGYLMCGTSGKGTNLDLAPFLFPQSWHLPSMINVAASDQDDLLMTSLSNWGTDSVDLAAPGINVLYTTDYRLGGAKYSSTFPGTSISCWLVSGAAALIAAGHPSANAGQIKAALLLSVDTNSNLIDKVASRGRLNLASAITNYDVLGPNAGPCIYVQPESQTNGTGCAATFSVVAVGPSSSRLTYQWQCNGIPIENATNATVALSNPQPGNYQVLVMNGYGTATSAGATLTLKDSPIILEQPAQEMRVLDGTDVTLNVSVAGACPMSYQWQYQGTNLVDNDRVSGATSPTLVLSNVCTNDTGPYQLLISNDSGTTSAVVSLTVLGMPRVVMQPRSQTVAQGADANFCVEFTNTASQPVRIRWWHNANVTPTVSLTNEYVVCTNLQNIQTNMAGTLYMTLNNPATRITCLPNTPSSNAYLAVVVPPTNQFAQPGGCVSFRAQAFGTNLSFQWQFAGTNLVDNDRVSGATNSTLTISNSQCSDAGLYLLVVTNHDAEPAFFPVRLDFLTTVRLVFCEESPYGCLTICWCNDSGLPPQLQWTDDLSRPTPWPVWPGTIPPGPGLKCIQIPCNERMKFFRMVLPP